MENDTPIVLYHATHRSDVFPIEKRFREDLEKLKNEVDPALYDVVIKYTHNFAEAILAEIQRNDLVIMGAPEEGLVRRAFFGDLPLHIAKQTDVPIILTKRYTGHVKSWFQKFFGSRKTMLD
jgi:nucleotide-binding universal stress UspA family protein